MRRANRILDRRSVLERGLKLPLQKGLASQRIEGIARRLNDLNRFHISLGIDAQNRNHRAADAAALGGEWVIGGVGLGLLEGARFSGRTAGFLAARRGVCARAIALAVAIAGFDFAKTSGGDVFGGYPAGLEVGADLERRGVAVRRRW